MVDGFGFPPFPSTIFLSQKSFPQESPSPSMKARRTFAHLILTETDVHPLGSKG
jgi:hypothetical protein